MNRAVALLLVGVALIVGVAVFLLVGDDGDGPGAGAGRSLTAAGAPAVPRFDKPAPAAAPAPVEPLALPAGARDGLVRPPMLPSAAPSGPKRRVTGHVLRLADGSPLEGLDVLPATRAGAAELESRAWEPSRDLVSDWVVWMPRTSRQLPGHITDADGRFDAAALPADATGVAVPSFDMLSSTLTGPMRVEVVELPPASDGDVPDVLDLEVILDSGWIAAGSVRDSLGRPVPGAQVSAHWEGWFPDQIVTTDAEGGFRLVDLPNPSRDAVLDLQSGAACRFEVLAPGFVFAQRDIAPPEHSVVVAPLDFRLERAGTLEGWVSDTRGQPLAGARVKVEWAMGDDHGRRPQAPRPGLVAQTENTGAYRIGNIPPGRYVVGVRLAPTSDDDHGRQGPWVPGVEVFADEATRLDLHVAAGAELSGRVADVAGNPEPEVRVELVRTIEWDAPGNRGSTVSAFRDGEEWSELRTNPSRDGPSRTVLRTFEGVAVTDAQGVYRFTGVSPGTKQITTAGRDGVGVLPVRHDVDVLGHEFIDGFDFVLGGGAALRGRVTDTRGIPLADVYVVVREPGIQMWTRDGAVRTDDTGRFEVQGLPEGDLRVWFSASGHADQWLDVSPGQPDLDVVLEPAHFVVGLVLAAGTGEPLAEFYVSVDGGSTLTGQNVESDEGAFEIAWPSNAEVTVRVSAPGFVQLSIEGVRPDDTSLQPLRFQLPRLP